MEALRHASHLRGWKIKMLYVRQERDVIARARVEHRGCNVKRNRAYLLPGLTARICILVSMKSTRGEDSAV